MWMEDISGRYYRYIRGEKIKHNDLNCNLSSAGSGLAGGAVVSFPLGQLCALPGRAPGWFIVCCDRTEQR